ncbi:MAG: HAD family hydrolase [Dehalococcoidia bacterium]
MSTNVLNPQKFDEKPSAVLFDLDNTLYAYDPAHEAGSLAVRNKVLSKIGIEADDFDAAFSRARTEIKNQLGETASSHSRLLYFQRTLEHLNLRSQSLLSLELEQTYWGSFLAASELREGVGDFLDQLARADIPRALVTDLTAQIQFRKLVFMELDRRFEYVVTSEESGHDKPHKAGFELAIAKLKSGSKSANSNGQEGAVWMIGDNVTSDIEGAKSAINATTLALKSEIGDQSSNPAIDMIFDSFTDLERFVSARGWDRANNG